MALTAAGGLTVGCEGGSPGCEFQDKRDVCTRCRGPALRQRSKEHLSVLVRTTQLPIF